jgi:hypothetical protein
VLEVEELVVDEELDHLAGNVGTVERAMDDDATVTSAPTRGA